MDSEHVFLVINGAVVLLLGLDRLTTALGRIGKLPERWQKHWSDRNMEIARKVQKDESLAVLASIVDPLLQMVHQNTNLDERFSSFERKIDTALAYIEMHTQEHETIARHHDELTTQINTARDAQYDIYLRFNRVEAQLRERPV